MADISITGIGAVTPVGLSAASSAAALRAGIARLGPIMSSLVDGPAGASEPAVGGRVPIEWFDGGPLEEEWPGHDRFEHAFPPAEHLLIENGPKRLSLMAAAAAAESWNQARSERPSLPTDWGLFLGIDDEEDSRTQHDLVDSLSGALGGFRPVLTEVVAEGRASGLAALHHASIAMAGGKIAGAIVGGVDSLVRPAVYSRLAGKGVLKDASSNPQGVHPGEAAAFLTLETGDGVNHRLARLIGSAEAREPSVGTDAPNQGKGLTEAIRKARATATLPSLPLVICDLNGDRYRALEWSLVLSRALGDLPWREDSPTSGEFWHPADCIGDSGAASGLLNCVWAVEAMLKDYSYADQILVWGASDGPLRAATILTNSK